MLLIRCPYCEEERPELEFRHAGQAHIARPTNIAEISDGEFEEYFFIRQNPKGLYFERWRHIHGCARFFNAARDTVSDKFVKTYKAGEPKPSISLPKAKPAKRVAAKPASAKAAPKAAAAKATGKSTRKAPAKRASVSGTKTRRGAKKS
ncbi:MAG: sarcosine oxidase subunit delta [Rhizobiaceae bacterium]|nr:sarcosine oxidase subunit delta [Rhizobiaceae bacterium]